MQETPDQILFEATLREAAESIGVALAEPLIHAMYRHYLAMVRQNKVMNLTRITDPAEAAVKHYADSLALAAWAAKAQVNIRSLLDVGTGAGFPAIPLAVARLDWRITAIDGTRKKVDFVGACAKELGLSNLRAEHAHAKHWEAKDRFDVVTLRAVCKLSEAIDMCARFINRPGCLVIYKTAQLDTAEQQAGAAAARETALVESSFAYELAYRGEIFRRSLHCYRSA